MKCPRCNYEWDVRLSLCPRCNLNLKKTTSPIRNEAHTLSLQKAAAIQGSPASGAQADMQQLLPGVLLHRDRYGLQKTFRRREWPLGIVETIWSAADTRFTRSSVVIYELNVPNDAPKETHAIPYVATKIFTSVGQHPHILALRDVFREKGRSFFVFEPIYGLSLLSLMRRSSGKLPEQEVITCCLQIADLLDVCSQQSLPLIHANIRAEYIVKKPTDSQHVLTNFSVALAGGLAQIMADMAKVSFSPYNTTEPIRGKIDGQTDLSALLTTAHYAATGRQLSGTNALGAGSDLSPGFRAILLKGLGITLHRGYQKPSELYQDLLALRSEYRGTSPSLRKATGEQGSQSFAPTVQVPKQSKPKDFIAPIQPIAEQPERTLLVPLPEELPLLKEGHDMRNAILWFVGMLLCLVILLGHGLI
jgi:serine/threonine protein kinase